MSAEHGSIIECWRCRATTVVRTDGNGNLVETKGVCTCPQAVESVAVAGDMPMTGRCVDCGGPCRNISKRCTPCGHAWSSAEYDRRRQVRRCPCGAKCKLMARLCRACRDRNAEASKRAYQKRGRRPRSTA